ncbi:inosose dehydratase [Streptomyces litmocidini]|uniref:TIM barrel protein n=1 Tax=Streptomyces litmocidini TaxID=67318 RepID=UPI00167EBA9D|nr:TIM barrel protein [Streptomyces litmocidini]GGU80355.1 inosose dehydratase [Streptomyces litmocidini]
MRITPPGADAPLVRRIAGAPISWGVCEVPGWGHQLAPDVVLRQMRDIGLAATEFGPDGFLPDAPAAKAEILSAYGLRAVGQFVPVVLHDPDHDPLPRVETAMADLLVAGATTVVVAAVGGGDGYDDRPAPDADGWSTLLANLDRIDEAAAEAGLTAALHPHVGTLVETAEETRRVLDGCRIALCLDTGHYLIGGGDPVALAARAPDRIAHVHLKDVRRHLADQVRSGELTYTQGVAEGMYAPLGAGDVDIAAIVRVLESHGYSGWYVLEQDTVLPAPPGQDGAHDPLNDAKASLERLLSFAEAATGPSHPAGA